MDFAYKNKNFVPIYSLVDRFKTVVNPGVLLLLVAPSPWSSPTSVELLVSVTLDL